MPERELSNIETLVEKNHIDYYYRWAPTTVGDFEKALTQGDFRGMNYELRKNIAYSLQYLQYLQLQLDELNLHSVIQKQLWKSYIIISMGIVEGLFYHLLKKSGNQTKTEWEETLRVSTNVYKEDGTNKKNEIITYRKLSSAKDARMDFESMIAKVKSKQLLKLPLAAYPHIKGLKEIRNKVHLFISKKDYDTDFNKLTSVDYHLARYVLYRVLKDDVFAPKLQGNIFEWLKLSTETVATMTEVLKQRREKQAEKQN